MQDVGVVAPIFKECFASPPWNEAWTDETAARRLSQFMGTETCRGVVAFDGERAVGFALGQLEGWVDGNIFLIQEVCVVPDRQRSGIGGRLLERLLRELEVRDRVTGTYLLTDAGSAAEAFYLGRGFQRSGRKIVLSAGRRNG
ncbi:MAG TPA: GNAT family N-acetyltransferase [Polyangia bacterium]|nr:GNAT family N-acetyltransferase [Polyangia bacterium]